MVRATQRNGIGPISAEAKAALTEFACDAAAKDRARNRKRKEEKAAQQSGASQMRQEVGGEDVRDEPPIPATASST